MQLAVRPRSKSFRQAVLCLALAATWLLPLAHAELRGETKVVDNLLGECHGELSFVPLQTLFFFDDKASIPAPTFLTGTSLRLERAEGTDAHVRRGPLGSGNLFSHYRSETVETIQYDAFQIDLVDFLAGSTISAMPEISATPTWASAEVIHRFEMHASTGEVSVYGDDQRDVYNSEPAALRLSGGVTQLTVAGDMRFFIEQTEFKIRTDAKTDSYRAEHTDLASEDAATEVHYFLLHVTDARLTTGDAPVAAALYADIFNIGCVGTIFETGTPSPAGDVSQPVLIATGDLEIEPRRDAARINVQYTVGETSTATSPESANVGIAPSAFPYWGLLVALGFVATGGGVAAWRLQRTQPRLPQAAPVKPAAEPTPLPKTGPRTLADLENLYRQDPANMVVALELGLAYAKKNQPHEALPLLQLAIQEYPKMDAARYFAGIAFLEIGRIDDGLRHLSYAFRLNALNVARFINEGAALTHGQNPRVRAMLARWSRQFQESNARGYV